LKEFSYLDKVWTGNKPILTQDFRLEDEGWGIGKLYYKIIFIYIYLYYMREITPL